MQFMSALITMKVYSMNMSDVIRELRSNDGAASKIEQVGWNTAKLSVPVSDYKRVHAIITVEHTDDNGTANSVRVQIIRG